MTPETPKLHTISSLKGLFGQIYLALGDMFLGYQRRIDVLTHERDQLEMKVARDERTILRLNRKVLRLQRELNPPLKRTAKATKHK